MVVPLNKCEKLRTYRKFKFVFGYETYISDITQDGSSLLNIQTNLSSALNIAALQLRTFEKSSLLLNNFVFDVKLRTYRKFKFIFRYETYISNIRNISHRNILTRFRSFIGGENHSTRRKPPIHCKSLTNLIT
jgi:hypothetical protein